MAWNHAQSFPATKIREPNIVHSSVNKNKNLIGTLKKIYTYIKIKFYGRGGMNKFKEKKEI